MSKESREERRRQFDEAFGAFEVEEIPADPRYLAEAMEDRHELVGAYCRVSTLSDGQVESYELQKKQYEMEVASHPNWELVDIYADEGISATSIKKRKEFLRLLEDCRAHKITLVLVKSVTRFARNLMDCVSVVRELKRLDPPVGVLFENENLNTLSQHSETILNVYATLAQSESETKSAAIKWGIRRRAANGMPRIVDLYGYTREGRRLFVQEREASVVRCIYQWFLDDYTIGEIISMLHNLQVPSPKGLATWNYASIIYILTNEKYMGMVLTQKTFVEDVFSHKSIKNNKKQLAQHLYRGYCPIIVPQNIWDRAQTKMSRKSWDDFLDAAIPIEVAGTTLYPINLI